MGASQSSAFPVEDLSTSTETVLVKRYKTGVIGRGVPPGRYVYVYVSPADGIVIEPGVSARPVRRYSASEFAGINNSVEQVPVRRSPLHLAKLYLNMTERITNEIQRQLAVN